MTLISVRDLAQYFFCEVQSKHVCSVVASLTGEMAAPTFACYAHGTADSDKSSCYPWFVCHDRTLDQQCILAQAHALMMINHLTSFIPSNSWNKWVFEMNNHFNWPNWQILLSFLSHTIMFLVCATNFLLSKKSSTRLEWGESVIAFQSPCIQALLCESNKQLNFLRRWPVIVLLLSMLCITKAKPVLLVPTVVFCLQLPTIYGRHIHCSTHECHGWPTGKQTWSFHCRSCSLISVALTCLFIVH